MTTSLLAYLLIPLFTAVIIPFAARTRHKLADVLANVTLLAGLINIGAILFNPANIANSFSNITEDGFALLMIFVIYLVALCVTFFSPRFPGTRYSRHLFPVPSVYWSVCYGGPKATSPLVMTPCTLF